MQEKDRIRARYTGLVPKAGYVLEDRVGAGKIGEVYRAVATSPIRHEFACKIIAASRLKTGWETELQKVLRLSGVPGVVQYHDHGSIIDAEGRPVVWVFWDFVDGSNLQEYAATYPRNVNLPLIQTVAVQVLNVLFACKHLGIQHGDLHVGNILIGKPDPRLPGSPERIWITDFGYGGSHSEVEPKDDYRQLFSVCTTLLHRLRAADLNARDRLLHGMLEAFLDKELLERDPTEGEHVGDPAHLADRIRSLSDEAERKSAQAAGGTQHRKPDDYLWAEALGLRAEDWRHLFVPDFLSARDLLRRNTTVLTGARGCGKTMAFRRLTAFMDLVIGGSSGVEGADEFVGFYVNCRDLVEAFPWIPPRLTEGMQQQITHYFHLAWLSEVLRTVALHDQEDVRPDGAWVNEMMHTLFSEAFQSLPIGADTVSHARAFIEEEKERCLQTPLGRASGLKEWPLARGNALEHVHAALARNVSWIGDRPLYLFLDDYTIPIVPRNVQEILNPIIFARKSHVFFKISSESSGSFSLAGVRGKRLELHHDFEYVDLASESLRASATERRRFLLNVFRPRMEWHPLFRGKEIGLEELLGKRSPSGNALAWKMRQRKTARYFGIDSFVGMWSSDTRILIRLFADMIRTAEAELSSQELPSKIPLIRPEIQDRHYREAGADYLKFVERAVDPQQLE